MKEMEEIKKKAERGILFAKDVRKILTTPEKEIEWAKKMSWLTSVAKEEKDLATVVGLIGGELSKEEMGLATLMLIKQTVKELKDISDKKSDIAFM